MANYYGKARTNYVALKDPEACKAKLKEYKGYILIEQDGKYGFLFEEGNTSLFKKTDDEWTEIEFEDFLAPFMEDGEVCVVQGCGSEKMRYLIGFAYAFNNKGKMVSVSIDDIYRLAEKKFGVKPGYATY